MGEKPTVVVYRDALLSYSETFIRDQGEELRGFTPYYVGSHRVEGLSLPAGRTITVSQGTGEAGRAREALYKLWGFAPGLYRRVRRIDPALVHAHFGPDGVSALSLARTLRVPLLVTFHGYDATTKDEYARRSFYRHRAYLRGREMLQREARLFIAVSRFIKDKLLEQGFPPEKTVVHYNGVDLEALRADPAARREPVVLFVGRLVEKKGCGYLVEAMARVQATSPDAELVVIGEGPLRASLERLAARTLPRYRFLGAQDPKSVRDWMHRASVLSVPSVTTASGDCEGFGLVFAEAQAARLPVVSFATGPVPEVVAHEKTGFLAPERDWKALADYITRLLQDAKLRRRFGALGAERARAMFDLHHQTRTLEELYGRFASGSGE